MSLLSEFIAQQQPRPVDWRESHCCTIPARWVALAEGAAPPMPAVDSQLEALSTILRRGGLVEAVSQIIGRRPVAAELAQPCDLVAFAPGTVGAGGIGVIGIVLEGLEPAVAIAFAGPQATLHPVTAACAAWEIAR